MCHPRAKVIGVARHRLTTDGDGVTTLVAFHGCPLRCKISQTCLRPQFISEFRELCGPTWQLNIETSLNVPAENITALLPVINTLIIDIKDLNPAIYRDYTGTDNTLVLDNLRLIADVSRKQDCIIRIPLNHYLRSIPQC